MKGGLAGSPLLDAATLGAIRDLRLAAQTLVEGFLAGQHLSRGLAAGAEFSQFRSYGPGDDPRRIDWRLYARTDRFYLREAQAEREVLVRFVLDASASMTEPEASGDAGKRGAAKGGGAGKFEVARLAAAALGYLATLHGDAVALAAVGGMGAPTGRWTGGERGFGGFLHDLEGLRPGGAWPEPAELLARFPARRGRELVLVLTDGWERGTEMRRALAALRALRHEVLLLRVTSPAEAELPPGDDTVFEDAETGQRVAAGGAAMRAAYRARFAEHGEALRHDMAAQGVDMVELATDRPLDAALRGFLLRRRQVR
jgi:uncharacterized protein (DUF58 family)